MQDQLISQGLNLMALGMGVVFIFLALLVVTTQCMSAVVSRYFPPVAAESLVDTAESSELPDSTTIAVIQQAIRMHRNA